MSSSRSQRSERALRSVRRELRKPRNLVGSLRKSGAFTLPLLFAGPSLVLVAYLVAFAVTPDDRVDPEFFAAASQIIPVLLLVLAVEGQAFRWQLTMSALSTDSREELMADEEGHIDYLETQIDLVGRIGEQNWGQLNAKPADEIE